MEANWRPGPIEDDKLEELRWPRFHVICPSSAAANSLPKFAYTLWPKL
jgi:hypothetical protein